MTAYYVSNSGSDSNNGLTEGTAFASPGHAASVATTAGDVIYIKADGIYNFTTSTTNASGGFISLSGSVGIEGYGTTVGDNVIATIANNGFTGGSGGNIAMINHSGSADQFGPPTFFKNIKLDGRSDGSTEALALTLGLSSSDEDYVWVNCEFHYGTIAGLAAASGGNGYRIYDSYFYNVANTTVHTVVGCFFEQSQVTAHTISNCIGKNIGSLWDFPAATNLSGLNAIESVSNTIIWNDSTWSEPGHKPLGSSSRWNQSADISNCIIWSDGRLPYWDASGGEGLGPMHNVAYGNMSDPFSATAFGSALPIEPAQHRNVFEIFGDPFVDAPNNDFRLKKSGAGLLLRNNFVLRDLP